MKNIKIDKEILNSYFTNLYDALNIVNSYKRGRPSKQVIEARKLLEKNKSLYDYGKNRYNEKIKNKNKSIEETKTPITDKNFKNIFKTFIFKYDDEAIYENLDMLFYAVRRDILYGRDPLIRRFNEGLLNKTYYIQFKALVGFIPISTDTMNDDINYLEILVTSSSKQMLPGNKRLAIEDLLYQDLLSQIFNYQNMASGLIFKKVIKFYVDIAEVDAVKGRSFINTPKWLQNKKMTINIKNTDDKCFYYAVAVGLLINKGVDIDNIKKHPEKTGMIIKRLKEHNIMINEEGLIYPVNTNQYKLFADNNKINLNVFLQGVRKVLQFILFFSQQSN